MEQKWTMFKPNCGFELKEKYFVDCIVYDHNGLLVFLNNFDETSPIKVQFPGVVYAFRQNDELGVLKYLSHVTDKNGYNMISDWSFFLVSHSEYIKFVQDESQGCYPENLIHFSIIDGDGLLEVITDKTPVILLRSEKEYKCKF